MLELRQQLQEKGLSLRAGEQIAGDAHEVRLALGDPVDRLLDGASAARGDAQVKVREVRDAEPVELGRGPPDRQLPHTQPHPAGLAPRPGGSARVDASRTRNRTQPASCHPYARFNATTTAPPMTIQRSVRFRA